MKEIQMKKESVYILTGVIQKGYSVLVVTFIY